jgi:hypothetical protein
MNAHLYTTGLIAVLLFGSSLVQGQEKKPAVPAKPAAKAATPAKGATPAAGSASKGAAAPAAKAGPTAAGAAKSGPTTAGAAKAGPSTAGKSAPSTAGRAGTANTAGRGPAAVGAGRAGTPAAGRAGGASAANRGGPAGARREPAGSHTARAANGSSVRTRANGSRADVHDAKRGMDIHHGLNGNRRVATERADHSRIVSERGGRGYAQGRPYSYRGHDYARRTYYDHGRAYDRYYSRYGYHGVILEGYAPGVYFAPAFYGWAYNPWVAPVPYAWGFVGNPWYGFYGAYFTPYPVYPSASFWLADYIISQSLAANYAAQQAAAQQTAMAPDAAPMTPDIKNLVAEEVKRQLALENQEAAVTAQNNTPDPASSGIARMLSDNIQHVFVAGGDLDVIDASGTECAVSEGDALQLTGPPAADATAADLVVLSSKGGVECHKGATVSVALTDLQDMQNHMRETIDAGMGDLQKKGGQGGLPAVPASAQAAPVKAEFTAIAPPPDPNAAAEIAAQGKDADAAEKEVAGQVPADGSGPSAAAPPAAPAEVGLGQTIDEVTAILGQPKSKADLGNKKIYVYSDMKITFTAGKVTDIQ